MSAKDDDEFGVADDLENLLGSATPPAKKAAAKPEPTAATTVPAQPQAGLTADEVRALFAEMKDGLRAEIAADLGAKTPAPKAPDNRDLSILGSVDPPQEKDTGILLHFIEDGFTIGGRVFYRGEEYWAPRDTEWAKLSTGQQILRWKKQYFRPGPWEGAGFDLTDPNLTEDDRVKLLEVMRNRTAAEPVR